MLLLANKKMQKIRLRKRFSLVSRKIVAVSWAICCICIVFATTVSASPSFTTDMVRMNATTSGDQINPSVAALPGNQFVMTWSDRAGNDGDRGGIFGRIYDATLTPVTSDFVVNTLTTDWQSKSNVASADNGNFMVVWHQSNGYVEGQLFDASGQKLGAQFTVQEGFNGLSDVVADAQGNFWVVSTVNNGSGYISKYSNSGTLLVDSKVFQSNVVAFDPVVTSLTDGRILVGWYDGQNTSGSDIYGQLITAEGELLGSPFQINTTLADNQSKQAVAGLESGGFVVSWQSLSQDGDLAGIYSRVFDSSGTGGAEIAVNTKVAGNQINSHVISLSDGGFIVGWVDSTAPQQVYMQLFADDGSRRGTNLTVSIDNVTTVNNSQNIEFTELSGGSLVAVWDAWKGSRDIYGRLAQLQALDSDGDGTRDGLDSDDDGDGVADIADAFPLDASESVDTDSDGIGNVIDDDDDGDGVIDVDDAHPLIALGGRSDTDGDGRPDDCDAQCQALGMSEDLDDDGDSMPDILELEYGLDPLDETDCPSWFCGSSRIYLYKTASNLADSDGDGLNNKREAELGTDKNNTDSDGDGLSDGVEVISYNTNPLVADSDGDGLSDGNEVTTYATDPLSADTDGDSVTDGNEIQEGLNPLNPDDCPSWICGGNKPWLYILNR